MTRRQTSAGKAPSAGIRTAASPIAMIPNRGRMHSDAFEAEVRRVARALFPQAGGLGGVVVDGRERDCVLNDGETIHIIEATCDPRKEKANKDLQKSIELKREFYSSHPDHNFKIWFVTEKDPTPDQTTEADAARKKARCPVLAMSLPTFGQRLVDAPAYLSARDNYHFGSVRNPDPSSQQKAVEESTFLPLDMVNIESKVNLSPDALSDEFQQTPGIRLLLGDFGAGKSMTMRHMYFVLRDTHKVGKSARFPVYLNLRDHVGQEVPSSALYDHGTRVGFSQPERLVRAWRAGFVHLFLDGFDEIASSRFRSDAEGLRAVRRRAMTLIRRFIEEHPSDFTTIFISGRENYFGTPNERAQALGLSGKIYETYTLNEFTLAQVQQYLSRLGLGGDVVPDWLPSRPLLVGYLAVREILTKSETNIASLSRAEGWDYLLDQICRREGSQIADLGGQADRVRGFVDRLATRARATSNGRGPVSAKDMMEVYRLIMPSSPDEAAQQLLLRMAGLTASSASGSESAVVTAAPDQEDAREFVDSDLVDAARAGDVVRFVEYPYDEKLNILFSDPECRVVMGDIGIEVASHKLPSLSAGQASAALRAAVNKLNAPTLAFDIFRIMQHRGLNIAKGESNDETIELKGGIFPELEFVDHIDYSAVVLNECFIESVYVDGGGKLIKGPTLNGCLIERVIGLSGVDDLPSKIINQTNDIEEFVNNVATYRNEPRESLPPSVRVLVTSLQKLFVQPGSGRKENAFPRGLDDVERTYVDDVLRLMVRYDFAHPHRMGGPPVWLSNRAKKAEAMSILRSPHQSDHPLIVQTRNL